MEPIAIPSEVAIFAWALGAFVIVLVTTLFSDDKDVIVAAVIVGVLLPVAVLLAIVVSPIVVAVALGDVIKRLRRRLHRRKIARLRQRISKDKFNAENGERDQR